MAGGAFVLAGEEHVEGVAGLHLALEVDVVGIDADHVLDHGGRHLVAQRGLVDALVEPDAAAVIIIVIVVVLAGSGLGDGIHALHVDGDVFADVRQCGHGFDGGVVGDDHAIGLQAGGGAEPRGRHQDADLLAFLQAAVAAAGAEGQRNRPGFVGRRALVAQDRGDAVALLHDVNAFAGRVAAGDLVLGLRQQRDVFRHHAGFKAGIGIGNVAFGGVGELEIGLGAAGVGCGIGKRRVADAARAAPVRGIAHPHQDFVERDHGGEFRLRQHRCEILGNEGNLGVGFDGLGIVRILGSGLRRGADIGQHALGVERRDLGAEIARRHRQIAGDADERPHPHHVAVADAGDGRDPHHVARGAGFAGRRQAVALVQGGGAIVGAERPAQRAFDALRHLGKGHFAVERRKNGAADESRAAQTGQDSAAKPLYGDTAAIDHRSLGAIDGKRRLVTEIDDPDLASIAAPAWRLLAQPCVPPNSINIRQDPRPIQTPRFRPFEGAISGAWRCRTHGNSGIRGQKKTGRSLERQW